MTLKEFAGVDSHYRDIITGTEIEWRDYMHRIINKLGIENIKGYIPYKLEFLKEEFKKDKHFNTTDLSAWLMAAGFDSTIDKKTRTKKIIPLRYGLCNLFVRNGITCFSPSEGVATLKEAARILCKEGK